MGAALLEEVEMAEKYEEYCKKAPFRIPLPKPVAKAITTPMKIIRGYSKSVRNVVVTVALYAATLMTTSYLCARKLSRGTAVCKAQSRCR